MGKLINANLHRFHDKAAISLPGNGETVYLTAHAARQLAHALHACARSIETKDFLYSNFGTMEVCPDYTPQNTIEKRYGTVLRVYDNGGKTCDRYTILPPRWARQYRERDRSFSAIAASERPFHPQGFGQHVSAVPGHHLGKRVAWATLPHDVQRFAKRAFPEYAP